MRNHFANLRAIDCTPADRLLKFKFGQETVQGHNQQNYTFNLSSFRAQASELRYELAFQKKCTKIIICVPTQKETGRQ